MGLALDPLIGMDDAGKPLRSRLLAVPALKARYLDHVRTLAEELDWDRLRPVVAQYRALIEGEVTADTRKLSSTDEFIRAVSESPTGSAEAAGPRPKMGLRAFADGRRSYLLSRPEVKVSRKP